MNTSPRIFASVKNLMSGTALVLAIGAPLLGGCGPTHFAPVNSVEAQKAAGTFLVPAKVDILLAQDDTGSMNGIFDAVKKQMPGLLDNLESSGWDYRFATSPMTQDRALSEILTSHYDGNYGPLGLWREPFPGADYSALWNAGYFVHPSYFRERRDYTQFLDQTDLNNSANGLEPAFDTLSSLLTQDSTGFLRDDAMLVVLVIGNGNDTSGVNYCRRQDGNRVPCENSPPPSGKCNGSWPYGYGYYYTNVVGQPATGYCVQRSGESSFADYLNAFQGLKPGNPAAVKFFSAVSSIDRNSCLGAHAKKGYRYEDMATYTYGWTEDICSKPLSSILSRLSSELQAQRLEMRTRFVVVDQEPNLSTVKIFKLDNGNPSAKSLIPSSQWQYVGFRSDSPTVDYPAALNRRSGYFFRLNDAAALIGADTAEVEYLPVGVGGSL